VSIPLSDERASFDWPAVLHRLTKREDLTREEAAEAFAEVMEGAAAPVQIAAFLVALRTKGETVAEMAGLVSTMIRFATPIKVEGVLIDTCGTGGDRAGTINVSTLAAVVVAGAGGRVVKHGNRAASSLCGSADLLEALGVNIEAEVETIVRCVDEAGIGFCFAPRFHPAMRHAGSIRRELGIPTTMNFLGPLSNPAQAERQVVGVSDPAMAPKMAEVLRTLGKVRAMVLYGHDGLDELTTGDRSTVFELRDDTITTYEVDPGKLGLRAAAGDAVRGGDVTINTGLARRFLEGEEGAIQDIVCLNAAAALVVGGLADDLGGGLELARAAVADGRAARALERLVAVSQSPIPA
jgi:anthranilate phosphoribosyltransferase